MREQYKDIPERVEMLARAMCISVGENPDELFAHGYEWRPYPKKGPGGAYAVPAGLLHSETWTRYAWTAHQWIFKNSGGEFP